MTKLNLTHSHTPPQLEKLNEKINEILGEENLDTDALLRLINQRDEVITSTLKALNDSPLLKDEFSRAEMRTNECLLEVIKDFRQLSQDQLKSLIKGRKAVQKYA